MPDNGRHGTVAESRDEPQGIPYQVENAEGADVAIIVAVPARGAPVAPLIGSNNVKPRRRDGQHQLPPAVRELRESVQEQDAGPPRALVTGLQHVHREAVDVLHETGAYTGRESGLTIRDNLGHLDLR